MLQRLHEAVAVEWLQVLGERGAHGREGGAAGGLLDEHARARGVVQEAPRRAHQLCVPDTGRGLGGGARVGGVGTRNSGIQGSASAAGIQGSEHDPKVATRAARLAARGLDGLAQVVVDQWPPLAERAWGTRGAVRATSGVCVCVALLR